MQKTDITGNRYGHWLFLKKDDLHSSSKHQKWICQCDCGTIKPVFKESLLSGRSTSCGCIKYHNYGVNQTHGLSKSRIYREWSSMRRRCSAIKGNDAKNYSNRGIAVCDEWQNSFESFYQWSIRNGYSDSLTIDRIDNNLGYSPSNCRWVTISEQQSNKQNTIYVTYKGEKRCLRTLCSEIGFPYKTANRRYRTMLKRGIKVTTNELFKPILTNRTPFRYRKQD